MQRQTWRYGAARVGITIAENDVGVLRVTGVATFDTLVRLRADVVSDDTMLQARALVIDFRAAVIAIGDDSLPMPDLRVSADYAAMPMALLVSRVDEALFLGHAWQQATAGRVRSVFTDADEALAWAVARSEGSSALGMV